MKTTSESTLEDYFRREVLRAGGKTRKLTGEIHDPDQLTIWPAKRKYAAACVHFVELKRPGAKPRPGQARKLKRLNEWGCTALYLDTKELIDAYVEAWSEFRRD